MMKKGGAPLIFGGLIVGGRDDNWNEVGGKTQRRNACTYQRHRVDSDQLSLAEGRPDAVQERVYY